MGTQSLSLSQFVYTILVTYMLHSARVSRIYHFATFMVVDWDNNESCRVKLAVGEDKELLKLSIALSWLKQLIKLIVYIG